MPTGRAQRAEMRACGRRFVEVEGLRIKLCGKPLDLIRREGVLAEHRRFANFDVVEKLHAAPRSGGRRPIIIVLTLVITHVPD